MKKSLQFSKITGIIAIAVVINTSSYAQPSVKNTAYIVKISGDTIRECEIRESYRMTNEDKVTYIYNDAELSIPSKDLRSYYNGNDLFETELLERENKHVLISYTVGGTSYLGQSISTKGEVSFYIKIIDQGLVVNLADHKYNLLPVLKSVLPDFDAFYSTRNESIYYDYKSLAELVTAYNAFKDPSLFIPVKYKYRDYIKLGLNASSGTGNLTLVEDNSVLNGKLNYSFGLNYQQFYTRRTSLNVALLYNDFSFTGSTGDADIKSISFNPCIGYSAIKNPKFDIILKGGLNILYNTGSNLRIKGDNSELDISGIDLGSQLGVEFLYLNKYSVFANYLYYKMKTEEGRRFLINDVVETKSNLFQVGIIYYFKRIYSM